MERLYAVPSEKLRVWMVWLTGVGEIADEWHQWLRAHIDLIARIAEQRLQTVANNVPGGIKEIESVTNAKSEGILDNVMPRKEEKRDVSFNDEAGINDAATNDTLSAAKALSRKRVAESPEATARGESSANEDSSRTHNNPTTSGRRTGGGGEEESLATTAMADASETAWPIGTRWQPLTRCPIEKKADQMQTIQRLKLPQDEAERIEFLKNFTHQATLYGSYYKHWRETADQAVKEIAGRTVMTTAKFRGTGDSESTLDVAASQAAQYSMKQPESAVAQAIGGSTAATAETPMSSRIDPPTTDALGRDTVEVSIALSDDQSKVVEPSTKKETAGMELEFPSAKSDAVSPSVESEATSQPETTLKIRPTMEPIVSISPSEALLEQEAVAKRKAAEKLLGDMARAEEDIPYFFYLKAEPDMDIAIRYNDEKVIPPDLDRESISVNRRHLYFNLTDELGRDE
ncbi:uncharacterized protein LOC105258000 isoform X1 [Camponotus floridanus]|uniref:uncharacterized protein LOC105258000 isoform X1 n=1 Tax=Camponotus floridanus TaxID=104421 RepID=UPI000DC685D2|nr:uncharacterized protein LOC105258000 isoform X1 [Camponotus floridanus]XP_019885158.2 uncharacterized protein LOC105258000 isoform X1 [Camponotus floridanus]XP_019885159.2 uncharacterized protein LOC105258000 isoform X1 [Camponotus floridanus]XP_019885160.2 uncharacterized protein LOC105258000 isoform X1 [Camponotus floridanus]